MITGKEHAHLEACEQLLAQHRPVSIEDAKGLTKLVRKLMKQNENLRSSLVACDGFGIRSD